MNKTIKYITSIIGVILALTAFEKGIFEILQGNMPIPEYMIQTIGNDVH